MKIDVQYLQKRKNDWRYRRKVPQALKAIVGKNEIIFGLGSTETQAGRNYPAAHLKAEKMLNDALRRVRTPAPEIMADTPLALFQKSQKTIRQFGLDPEWSGPADEDDPEAEARDIIADTIAAAYPVDHSGYPIGVKAADEALIKALMLGRKQHRPAPTLLDAKLLYLKEVVGENEKKQHQLNRVFTIVESAIGLDRTIAGLTRPDAKEVLEYMKEGRSPSSADRYMNTVRAVINYAIREYDLTNVRNVFMNLPAEKGDKAEPDRRKRKPFTDEQLAAVSARIATHAGEDLNAIWRIPALA